MRWHTGPPRFYASLGPHAPLIDSPPQPPSNARQKEEKGESECLRGKVSSVFVDQVGREGDGHHGSAPGSRAVSTYHTFLAWPLKKEREKKKPRFLDHDFAGNVGEQIK